MDGRQGYPYLVDGYALAVHRLRYPHQRVALPLVRALGSYVEVSSALSRVEGEELREASPEPDLRGVRGQASRSGAPQGTEGPGRVRRVDQSSVALSPMPREGPSQKYRGMSDRR